jgi:hypothetical protein
LKITDVSGVNFVAVFNVKVTDAFEMRESVDVSCLLFIFSLSGFILQLRESGTIIGWARSSRVEEAGDKVC